MPRPLRDTITIADADGNNALPYKLLVDQYDQIQWFEEGVSADTMPPGEPVSKKYRFWGGGMGEAVEMGRGGYYYSENAAHGDPFALKPRPEIKTLTLTGNTVPVERFFEASDGTNWYLYSLAAAKSFKIKNITTAPALAETKTFSGGTTIFAQGKYTGNGTSQSITGAGFQPCAVIIKGDTAQAAIIRTADMPATYSKSFLVDWITTGITSLDVDGFSIGDSAQVNSNGIEYRWEAWKAVAGQVATGTYVGNGGDDRNIAGVGFSPAFVHILRGDDDVTTRPYSRLASLAEPYSIRLVFGIHDDAIQAFNQDGFQIGSDDDVNESAINFYWLAVRQLSGQVVVGTYDGDGGDSRSITGIGFAPIYVFLIGVKSDYSITGYGLRRTNQHTGDDSQVWYNAVDAANWIESLDNDGFTVGSHNYANHPSFTYHYVAVGSPGTPQVGKPAQWNSKWRVPMGELADAQTLSTVHDEGGAGDDTWATLYGLAARCFERRGNKLARATKRHVSLCSADDIGNLANWGAEYGGVAEVAIGAPGVEITDLVEWSNELAVCHTAGMCMFDEVATTKEQLPLLGGLTDDDNGKNTLRWASYILYPSADGYWRWRYGEHIRIDSDTILGNVPAKETTTEPLNLKHYGSAFCGDHIYHAVYDGTNYHLMHVQPRGETFVWDCLLTSANAIKVPYVDRNRYLWFGYGNDLAYIKLSQGGEPDGGNFGEASLVTNIYLDQKILADDIDVRLRMLSVICRNSNAEYKWELYASRDGGGFAKVGEDITADGVTKLYWDPTANLTARRLRLKVVGTATAGYTPTTTPPEIIGIEFFGETMPDDGRIIRAVIDLESEGRTSAKVKSELEARKNAGVVQVRDPVEDTVLNMIIFQCNLAGVKQKGHEPAIAGMMVYMRYGDTS